MLDLFKSLSTKTKMIIGGIVLLIILIICANVSAKNKEEEARRRQAEAEAAALANANAYQTPDEIDMNAELQKAYTESFGVAPEGFIWNADGTLQAISNNNITAEDTAYYFMRGLSTLDFSVAEKYSDTSTVVDTYNNYYNISSSQNYYTQFLRKMYKQCLLSIEINEVLDSAVFADGSRIITFSVNILDLTNKDFWKKDEETIYGSLYAYDQTESDGVKADQYIYDYALGYYSSENAKKRTVQVDLRLEKQKDGGWLVVDDNDLNMICSYEYGVNITEYVKRSYEDWVIDFETAKVSQVVENANNVSNIEESFADLPSNN